MFIFLLEIKFDTIAYLNKLKKNNSYFHTFINKESLAVGVIFLKPSENDTQEPHDSDEIYYILDGNGFLQINDKSHRIKKEEIYFVAKEHKAYPEAVRLIAEKKISVIGRKVKFLA